jgi:uncharacterized protein (TIGR03084 family)
VSAEATAPGGALEDLLDDLEAEQAALDDVLAGLPEAGWATPSAAAGWDVRDQVGHLAFGEDLAALAATRPAAFTARLEELMADLGAFADGVDSRVRALPPAEVLAWWRVARRSLVHALRGRDPGERIPWAGPDMSATSFARARLMETFAHGQDIRDGLGLPGLVTPRLRHVAALGVRTRGFAYALNGRPVPQAEVRVALDLPGGEVATWGAADASDLVRGPVEDFCLVVTRRRHPADTRLLVQGAAAEEWMAIAQCYLGPPEPHRPAGTFAPPAG